jgi:hypothetical protein
MRKQPHKATRIVSLKNLKMFIEFNGKEQREINFGYLFSKHPQLVKIKRDPILVLSQAKIDVEGGLEIVKGLTVTGPTLYHMGEIPIK